MKKSIFLLSSSSVHGHGFLEYNKQDILGFLEGLSTPLLFIPYAAAREEWDNYTQKVGNFFAHAGIHVSGIHTVPRQSLFTEYEAVFVGGGNTFRLLRTMQQSGLMPSLREAVMDGRLSYMGSSAGTNLAGKTICNTNDMPIVFPEMGFDALNLFPFQINPHYIDADPTSKHMGETREQRIAEYHQENDTPVVGIREGSYLQLDNNFSETQELYIGGAPGVKIFFRGKAPLEVHGNQNFSFSKYMTGSV